MPGWILVANRFSLLPTMRQNGGFFCVIASLTCLVVMSGCSNIRQQSLELPMPILPSESATATGTSPVAPDLPKLTSDDSSDDVSTAEHTSDNALALDPATLNNSVATKEAGPSPSSQSLLPNQNDFQRHEPQARLVGEQNNAETPEIKLTAVAGKSAPAPTITAASYQSEIKHCEASENCETPETCDADAAGQCDCCKKTELPKLAVVKPFDPEKLPELFGPNRTKSEDRVLAPLQTKLQPLSVASDSREPIRLTARQDSETNPSQTNPPIATSAQTQNKAQLLIPIAPAELQAFKAEVEEEEARKAQLAAASTTIQVSPVMDINSATENIASTPPSKMLIKEAANAEELADATDPADPSRYIPVSSSGIRVSAVPFQSKLALPPKPEIVSEPVLNLEPAAPAETPTLIATQKVEVTTIKTEEAFEISEPMEIVKPIESTEAVEIVELERNLKQDVTTASNNFSLPNFQPEPSFEPAPIETSVEQDTATQTTQIELREQTHLQLQTPLAAQVVDKESNGFVVTSPVSDIDQIADAEPTMDIDPLTEADSLAEDSLADDSSTHDSMAQIDQSADAAPSANIDPLAEDANYLPDMAELEKQLAEFKKWNRSGPAATVPGDRMNQKVLEANLDGPLKTFAAPAPAAYVADNNFDNDLIKQQLADQRSVLLELKNAVNQLAVKPVTTSPTVAQLTLNNAAFCTKISGFGQFNPFAANNFSGSQKSLLYCEVENQTARQFTNIDGSTRFETVLLGSIVIYDANDKIVQTAKFPAIKDVARHQRRDFYIYFPVQFNGLASGDYRLELSVEDASTNQTAVLQPLMRFSVR